MSPNAYNTRGTQWAEFLKAQLSGGRNKKENAKVPDVDKQPSLCV